MCVNRDELQIFLGCALGRGAYPVASVLILVVEPCFPRLYAARIRLESAGNVE
jgi:hypothetical protein